MAGNVYVAVLACAPPLFILPLPLLLGLGGGLLLLLSLIPLSL